VLGGVTQKEITLSTFYAHSQYAQESNIQENAVNTDAAAADDTVAAAAAEARRPNMPVLGD